jgi:hypothetical protein
MLFQIAANRGGSAAGQPERKRIAGLLLGETIFSE